MKNQFSNLFTKISNDNFPYTFDTYRYSPNLGVFIKRVEL